MVQLSETTLSEREIEFNATDVHFLGPKLTLLDCTLRVRARAKNFIVPGMRMINGRFEILSNLIDIQFDNAHFEGVTFTGKYSGIDFGSWDDSAQASIRDCDFSGAIMNGSRFRSTDISTIKLPAWPGFIIKNPIAAANYVMNHKWPENLGVVLEVTCDEEPSCSGTADNAQILADADGISLTEMRELLEPIPGMTIID